MKCYTAEGYSGTTLIKKSKTKKQKIKIFRNT